MENSVTAYNCPNCGGTINPEKEKCDWCSSFVNVKVEKLWSYTGDGNEIEWCQVMQVKNPMKVGQIIINE